MNSNQHKGPQFIRYFQPVINALISLGGSGRPEEVEDVIAQQLGLSEDVRNEQTSSGQPKFSNKVGRESGFEKVQITGKSGDGGLDGIGILQMNAFVSFKVLFQCKRYAGSVSLSQVRDFRGAMMGRADEGIILTTGTFTADARKEAVRDGVPPIELVDGEKILDMFEELQLGLLPKKAYDVDLKFFEEFK